MKSPHLSLKMLSQSFHSLLVKLLNLCVAIYRYCTRSRLQCNKYFTMETCVSVFARDGFKTYLIGSYFTCLFMDCDML